MSRLLPVFCIAVIFPLFNPVFSQTPTQTLNLERSSQRIPVNLERGRNKIILKDLKPGFRYMVVANPAGHGQSASYQTRMANKKLESEATLLSPADRPQSRRFVAPAESVELLIEAESGEQVRKIASVVSIKCEDCEGDEWIKKFIGQADALINTSGGVAANSLITNTLIGGNCFDVTNITSSGPNLSRGTFSNGTASIGINTGVVLCTGNVNVVTGPNNANNASGNTAGQGFNTNSPNDADLATLTAGDQYDVSKIEFDFKPTSATVQFDFVFGSDEYCEYVNSNFNDVFGFFISGPGITGTQNIALIPSTTTPVTINSVNHLSNTAYYVNNNTFTNGGGQPTCQSMTAYNTADCQLDGWTTVLTATAEVIPCSTYHIKLAIADIADGAYASAVFLRANSFDAGGQVKAEPVYPPGGQFVYEDCGQGFIRFVRGSGNLNEDIIVNYSISPSSTATEGVDYAAFPSPIVIPAGQTEILIPITVFSDLIIEGDETIQILLDNPCSCTQSSAIFTIRDAPPIETELDDQILCGGTSATLSPSVTGGVAPLTYLWSNNATSPSINVTQQGTNMYYVTVTDACGTEAVDSALVTLLPSPSANISGSGVLCVGQTGSFTLTVTMSGGGPWDIEWSGGGSGGVETFTTSPGYITVTEPGTYTLTSVNAGGCPGTVTGSAVITETEVDLSATPTNPLCFGGNGAISTSVTGGTGPYAYTWSPSGSGATSNNLPPGDYAITVTSSQGCTAETTASIVAPPELTVSANAGNIDCTTTSSQPTLDVNGGTPGYTYQWTGGSTSENPTFTTGGTYTVTVRDANNCSSTASVSITANTTQPVAVAVPTGQINCTNSTIEINGTGSSTGSNFTYEWSGPSIASGETTLNPIVDAPGTYVLTVTDADNGCTKTVSVTVTSNITPPTVVIATPPNIGCATPSFNLNANGTSTGANFTFEWTTAGGNFTGGTNTLTPTINQEGAYTLVVTNTQNGCTEEASVTVSGNTNPPTAVANPPATIDCSNSTIDIDASGSSSGGGFTYQWSGPAGGINSGGNTLTPTVDLGGTYTLTVTDTGNGCTATVSVTVDQNTTQPVAVATTPGGLTCAQPELTLSGTGSSNGANFNYEWSGPSIVSGETTLNPVIDGPGTYILTVTDTENGCTKTASVTITENITPPTVVIANPPDIGCNMPTIMLNANGTSTGANFTFVWSTLDGNFTGGTNTLTPSANLAGTYTLVVTNTQNGCTEEASVTVEGDTNPPVATVEPPATINCDNTTIEIDASGSSSGGGFTYQWSGPAGGINSGGNTLTPTVDLGGTYTLTVTNTDNNCTSTVSVVVPQNTTQPNAVANFTGTITCQNPTLILNGTGSSTGANFTYEWGTNNGNIVSGETTLFPEINQGGTYVLTVTDTENGCTRTASVTVPNNTNIPQANAGPPLTLNCNNTTLTINGSGTTGSNISVQWTAAPGNIVSGANTYTPVVNQAGCYTLLVTNNSNGCTSEDLVCIDENFDTPDAFIAQPEILNCYNPTIELDAEGTNPSTGVNFVWTGPAGGINSGGNTATPTIDQPGVYTLVVTNPISGCTDTETVTVQQNNTPPIAEAGTGVQLSCTQPTYTLNGGSSSQGADFMYEWGSTNGGNIIFGETTLFPVVDEAGTYVLTVTNFVNGCTATDQVIITANQNFPNVNGGPDRQLNCNNPTVTLNASATPAGMTYAWEATNGGNIISGQNSPNITVDAGGTYFITVTNPSNGCTDVDMVEVENNIYYPEALISSPLQLNCIHTEIELDASGSYEGGNGSSLIYQWTGPNGGILNGSGGSNPTVILPGLYTMTVRNSTSQCTDTAQVLVTIDVTPPIAVATNGGPLTCQFPTVELSGIGSSENWPFFYEWSGPSVVSGEYSLTPVVNQIGAYTLTVTNFENGCTSSATTTVITNQTFPTAVAGAPQIITCLNDTLQLNGSGSTTGGAISYLWSTQNGQIVQGANTLTPLIDAPGVYELVVVNTQTGCTAQATVNIDQDIAPPTAIAAPGGVLSCTQPALSLSGVGSSSGANYLYQWSTLNGNILSGETSLNPLINATGQYILEVTNTQNGCSASVTTQVFADASIPLAFAGQPDTLTCQTEQITLQANANAGGADFIFEWSTLTGHIVSGFASLAPIVDAPGVYELLVTNTNNGCTSLATVAIAEDVTPPVAEAGPAAVINCYSATRELNGTGSSTGANMAYNWTTIDGALIGGQHSLAPTASAPGTYILEVINTTNGCQSTDQVIVTQNTTPPIAEAGNGGLIDCTHPVLTLNGVGSSAGAAFVYEWSTFDGNIASGGQSLQPVVDNSGLYTLLVTDTINGCTATDQVQVNKDANVPNIAVATPGILTCSTSSVQLDATASSQGTGIVYSWTTTGGNILSGQNTLTPTVDQAGQYQFTIQNTLNNCTAINTVTVLIDTISPEADAGNPAIITCQQPILTLDGSGSSQGSGFIYAWNTLDGNILNGGNTLNPQVDESGFYSIVVTNQNNGCSESASVQIILDQNSPEADAGAPFNLTCADTILSINGLGSSQGPLFTYHWSASNGGNIVSGENSLLPVIDQPGLYSLLVSNPSNGCQSIDEVTVGLDVAAPTVAIATPAVLNCQTTQLQLNALGSSQGQSFLYQWTTLPGGQILSGSNTLQPLIGNPGTYQISITNSNNGCTAFSEVMVLEDVLTPIVDAGPNLQLNCTETELGINGTALNTGLNYSVAWSHSASGNILSGGQTLTPVINEPGVYTVTVTNNVNFCSNTDQVSVTESVMPPNVAIAAPAILTCAITEVSVNASGSSLGAQYTYDWTTTDGLFTSGDSTLFLTVTQPGVYTLVVTNTDNHCTAEANVMVQQDIDPPIANAGAPVTLTCSQNSVALNGTGSSTGGNFSYFWSVPPGSNGNIINGINTLTPDANAPGWYQLEVTNNTNGCKSTSLTEVLQDVNAPNAAAASPGELTCTTTSIQLSGLGSSAGGNITYQWNAYNGGHIVGGNTTLSPTVNEPGSYILEVTNNDNGCQTLATVVVTENVTPPAAQAGADQTLTCTVGELSLQGAANGGAQGVTYQWTASNGGNIISGGSSLSPIVDQPGQYTLIVTDTYNGCTDSDMAIVNPDVNAPVALIANPLDLTCVTFSVQLNAGGSSTGADFVYQWNGPGIVSGAQSLTPVVNLPGQYTLSIENTDNGCVTSANINVEQDIAAPLAEAGLGFELTCSVSEGALDATGSSIGGFFTYQWTTTNGAIIGGATTLSPVVNAPGQYDLLVVNNANGCTALDMVWVTENTNYPSDIILTTELPKCGNQPGSITFTEITGGVGPYQYSIDGGDTFSPADQFGNLTPGVYPLVVRDANGCLYDENLTFPIPVEPEVSAVPEIYLEYGTSGTLEAQLNIPSGQIQEIIWSPAETLTFTDDPAIVIARPFVTTEYEVLIINVDGCEDRAVILVRVGEPAIWAPNVISSTAQNSDNNWFTIFSKEGSIEFIRTLQIYDRWGNKVFFTENIPPNVPNKGWDGSFRNKPMNPAVFVWWAEVVLTSGETVILEGDLTIME